MLGIGADRRLPNVLLIDDDLVSREVMATVLTLSGYTVHAAQGGREALELLDQGVCAPEVILMDTQMPGLSGAPLIKELRARTKAHLYAISGSHAPQSVLDGVDGFLMKPFGAEALQKILVQHSVPSHPAPMTDLPVLDEKVFTQMRETMPEAAVKQIYEALLADLDRRQKSLAMAIDRGDRDEVKRLGHAIKGGCGMAGARQAAQLGELLEVGGDDLEYSRSILPDLRAGIRNLQSMLDATFSPQGVDPA